MKKLLAVGLVALAFRLVVSGPALVKPERAVGLDTPHYIQLAQNLFVQHRFSYGAGPEILRTPVYPLFLAGTQAWHDNGKRLTLILQLLMGVGIALMAFAVGEHLNGNGLLPGVVAGLDPFTSLFAAMLYTETLFSLFALLALLLGLKKRFGLSGLVAGLAALTRPLGLALVLLALIPGLRKNNRGLAAFLVAFGVVVGLWIARNAVVAGYPNISTVNQINLFLFIGPMARSSQTGQSYQQALWASYQDMVQEFNQDPIGKANDPAFVSRAGTQGIKLCARYPMGLLKSSIWGIIRGFAGPDFNLSSRVLAGPPKSRSSLARGVHSLLHGDINGFVRALRTRISTTPWQGTVFTLYSWLFLILFYGLFITSLSRGNSPRESWVILLTAVSLVVVPGPLSSFRFAVPGHALAAGLIRRG